MIEIVPMGYAHTKELARLEAECFSSPWSQKALEEELEHENAHFLVALIEGEVAGYVGMLHVLDEGDICNVAVFPRFRRKGVATALIEELFCYGQQKKLSFITLEVRRSNMGAQSFYQTMGFEPIGVRKNFYSDPQEDAVLMNYYFQ